MSKTVMIRALLVCCAFLFTACSADKTSRSLASWWSDKENPPQKKEIIKTKGNGQNNMQSKKAVFGWIEKAIIDDNKTSIKAKLDPGAKTSSVNADIIKTFTRDNKEYVLYKLKLGNETEDVYEREIVRWVKIKKKKEEGYIERPIVILNICVGNKILTDEVSLSSRDHFNYPVLIGRNMLKDDILVDSAKTFVSAPDCQKDKE